MVRNLILGAVLVMLFSLALMSCSANLVPTPVNPSDGIAPRAPEGAWAEAWVYPWPTRVHVQWDANTEADLAGYRVYRYSVRHNIANYSALAQSITPYVANLVDQIATDTSNDNAFVLYDEVGTNWAQYDDWGISQQYVYGYKVRAFDNAGLTSDPSESVFAATP